MEFIGLGMAVLIGLSLGLIGGGGSILTVLVLVYVVGINPVRSISYSLFIVGMTALIGAIDYHRKKLVDLKAALAFSIPSLTSVFLTRKFVLPVIPEAILKVDNFILSKGGLILLCFAFLMLFSAFSMTKQKQQFKKLSKKSETSEFNYFFIFAEGFVIGILTGFAGAGGGFLIIPALVLYAGLPMKMAIGTSLIIIAINSLIGFSTDLISGISIDWIFLGSFSCFAFAGILLGSYASKHIESGKLRPIFGWFTLVMAVFIILKELFLTQF